MAAEYKEVVMKRQERAQELPVIVPVWCVGSFCFFVICVSVMYWTETKYLPGTADRLDPPEVVEQYLPKKSHVELKPVPDPAYEEAAKRVSKLEDEAEGYHVGDGVTKAIENAKKKRAAE